MVNNIIKFKEENVDGCGGSAEVLVLINDDLCLSNGHNKRLQDALNEMKANAAAEDWDTDTMIAESIEKVFGDEPWECISPAMEIVF